MAIRTKAFLLCLVILILRAFPRLWHADIWAEDGTFLNDALAHGVSSIFIPYAGSFHPFQRFTLWLITKVFSTSLWAIVITWGATILAAFVFSAISSARWKWLVSSDRLRVLVACALCFTPGLHEMLGNIANLNWILVFYLMLLLIREPRQQLSNTEFVFTALVLSSIGTSVLFVPLLAWRIVISRKNVREIALLVLIVVSNFSLFLFQPQIKSLGDNYVQWGSLPSWNELVSLAPLAAGNTLARSALLRPWIGNTYASRVVDASALTYLGSLLALLLIPYLLTWWRRETERDRWIAFCLFTLGLFIWIIPAMKMRPEALPLFLKGGYWSLRYAFPLSAASLLLWVASLHAIDKKQVALKLFIVLTFLHGIDRFQIWNYAHPNNIPSWYVRSSAIADGIPYFPMSGPAHGVIRSP